MSMEPSYPVAGIHIQDHPGLMVRYVDCMWTVPTAAGSKSRCSSISPLQHSPHQTCCQQRDIDSVYTYHHWHIPSKCICVTTAAATAINTKILPQETRSTRIPPAGQVRFGAGALHRAGQIVKPRVSEDTSVDAVCTAGAFRGTCGSFRN